MLKCSFLVVVWDVVVNILRCKFVLLKWVECVCGSCLDVLCILILSWLFFLLNDRCFYY